MGWPCGGDPGAAAAAVLGWIAAVSLMVGPMAALLIKMGQLRRDIDAAWVRIRAHQDVISSGPEKVGEEPKP